MRNSTRFTWYIQSQQGLLQSVVSLNSNRQPFTEDTTQAQGISVPIFRESCVSRHLT